MISAISSLSGLVGYWPCDETNGTTAADHASSPADAVLSGTGGVLRPWNSPGGTGAVGLRPYSSAALTAAAASKLNVGDTFSAGMFFRRRAAISGALMQRGTMFGALGSELLVNADMENGLSTGWSDIAGATSYADTSVYHGGTTSIRVDVPSSGAYSAIAQSVSSAQPGRYTLTFWYRNDPANPTGTASMGVRYTPAGGGALKYLQGDLTTWSTSSADAIYGMAYSTTWVQKTLTFDLPEATGTGTSGLTVILKRSSATGGGSAFSIWFDDASLKAKTTTAGSYALSLSGAGEVKLVAGTGSGVATIASSDPAHYLTDHLGWHFVVVTKSGATTKIYIDGVDRTVVGTDQTLSASGTDLTWFSGEYGLQPVVGAHMFLVNRALSAAEQLAVFDAANMLPDRADNPQLQIGTCEFSVDNALWRGMSIEDEAAALRSIHVTAVREDFGWYHYEATQGVFDWTLLDAMVDTMCSHGLSITALFMPENPRWARPVGTTDGRYVPGSAYKGITVAAANDNATNGGKGTNAYSTWRDANVNYIVAAVHRYKDRVKSWELGNECNMSIFWGPAASAPLFVDWYHHARTAVLAELGDDAPNHQITLNGLARLRSESGSTDGNSYTADEWMRAILDLGIDPFDAVGVHPYISNNGSPYAHVANGTNLDGLHQIRDTLMEYNLPDVKVLLNEFGWYTENTRVAAASDGLHLPQSTIEVEDASWVNTYDPVASLGDLGGGTASGFYIETTNGFELFAHTGKTGNTLTGCTGGTGIIHTGNRISMGLNPITQAVQAQYAVESIGIVRDYMSAFCDTWTYFMPTNALPLGSGDAFNFCGIWTDSSFDTPKLIASAIANSARFYDPEYLESTHPYTIFEPTITYGSPVDPYNGEVLTAHDSSIVYWEGKYWFCCDGSTVAASDGAAGQSVWMSTSEDGVTWESPYMPLRSTHYCTNPVPLVSPPNLTDPDRQWQPNLAVVGDELWMTWTGLSGFVSKLSSPTGKWTNYRVEFHNSVPLLTPTLSGGASSGNTLAPTYDGISDWWVYFSSSPVCLPNGTVLCPATLETPTHLSVQTASTNEFTTKIKYNCLLVCTDGTWSMTVLPRGYLKDFAPWEPFVVVNPSGHVYVYSRNLAVEDADADMLGVAVSRDGGQTFTPTVSTKMPVVSSRGMAHQVSPTRWLLPHCDFPQLSDGTWNHYPVNRVNGSVFVSRRGVTDFVPGISFGGNASVGYPTIADDGTNAVVVYSDSMNTGIRRGIRSAKFPLPLPDRAYVYPRTQTVFNTSTTTDPTLVEGGYLFRYHNQMTSTATVSATNALSYTAWVTVDATADGGGTSILADCRTATDNQFGSVFFLPGLACGVNFYHGENFLTGTLHAHEPVFMAAVIDHLTVTLYLAQGGSGFTTVTGHMQSLLFGSAPADGDTVTINGVTYTFRTSASLTNEVAIGASAATAAANLRTKLLTASMSATVPSGATVRVICARSDISAFTATSGSSAITVESSVPLAGGAANIGYKAISSSALTALGGTVHDLQIHTSALTAANMTALYNAKASGFGYPSIAGTSTAPGSPLLHVNPADPTTTTAAFPSLGTHAYCETDDDILILHGEASASVELPYGVTEVTLRYRLGGTPAGTDKYVLATFGTVDNPLRLHISAANPTSLYANNRLVMSVPSPTTWNDVSVSVFSGKIVIGTFETAFSGKPRMFLGNAYPESLLSTAKTTRFDVGAMNCQRARRVF